MAPVDNRGVWAMGCAGASMLWGHGDTDDHGPNNSGPLADNIAPCDEVQAAVTADGLAAMDMGCSADLHDNSQQTVRSLHPGGAHICMCDGSVHFVSDSINVSTTWNYTKTSFVASEFGVWEELMSAGDGLTPTANSW